MHMHMHTHKCRKRCLFEWNARAMQSCSVRVMTQRNCNGRKRVLQHTILLACREGANVVCCVYVYVCVCARACIRVCVCNSPVSYLSRASSRACLRLVCVYIRVCICCHVHLRSDVQPLSLPSLLSPVPPASLPPSLLPPLPPTPSLPSLFVLLSPLPSFPPSLSLRPSNMARKRAAQPGTKTCKFASTHTQKDCPARLAALLCAPCVSCWALAVFALPQGNAHLEGGKGKRKKFCLLLNPVQIFFCSFRNRVNHFLTPRSDALERPAQYESSHQLSLQHLKSHLRKCC